MLARTLFLTSLMVGLLVSGCTVQEEHDHATHSHTDEPGSAQEAGNGTENSTNMPPSVSVSITDNGTALVEENGTFAAAVGVNLTFDASASSDPEGGNLTFGWDFGDGNSSSEAVAVYAFGGSGNFTVALVVEDDANGTSNQSFAFVVAPGGPAPGTPLGENKLHKTGTYTVAVQGTSCVANTQGVGATAANAWDIPAVDPVTGAAVLVTKIVVSLTGGPTTVDQAFRLTDPAGKNTDVDAADPGVNSEKTTLEGEFPPGAYKITVYGCAAANGGWTLDATATLVAA